MSITIQIVVSLLALLVGCAIGAFVHNAFASAKRSADEESANARMADKEAALASAKAELERLRSAGDADRADTSQRIESLQVQLREAVEARALVVGASESVQAIKEQLEAKCDEVEAYVQKVTTLSAEVAKHKKQAEEAVDSKEKALLAKDAEVQRLLDANTSAVERQIEDMRQSCQRQLADRDEAVSNQLRSLRQHCDEQLAAKDRHVEEQKQLLAQAEQKLAATFDSLSVKALTTISEEFLKTAKATLEGTQAEAKGDLKLKQQAIEELLKPFGETIKALDKRCQDSDQRAATSQALLKEQLDRLMGATDSLSSAFRKPNSRGNWGEKTLQNVFENSGLQEGHDYVLQHTSDVEDGKLRADAIVNLPKGRRLVVDAKNLWDGYQQAMTATDEVARQVLLQKHAQAVRNQVKLLSAKAYWNQYEGLDCVVMFMPTEAMYQAALEHDKEILNDAIASHVYLASPMTLVGLLRAVQYVLDQERLNQNAVEISEIGRKLYESLRTYGAHCAKVGSSLERTVRAYNESVGSLERNVLPKARQLRTKGVGSSSALPEADVVESLPVGFRSKELTEFSVSGEGLDADEVLPNEVLAQS